MMRKILHSFSVKHFRIGQSVYQQGREPAFVYIVMEGEFSVVKRIKKKKMEIKNDDTSSKKLLGQ